MKNLIELYKSFAASVGVVTDSEGFMSTLFPGSDSPKPWTVNTKRVVMPVPTQLSQPDWSSRIGFHPLLQNVAGGGDSPVMEKFRDRMNGYADYTLGVLLKDIGELALKDGLHKDLTPEQARYLGPFKDADGKFVKLITDLIMTKRISKKKYEFISFSLIKGRVWQGQKRRRVAVMHFPLYEALPADGKGTTFLGFTLRQKDVKMLRAIYEFLFEDIGKPAAYEVGSDSDIGPSIEALMACYAKFTEQQNKAVAILEPVISSSNALFIVDDWREDLENVKDLLPEIRHIPMLEGNTPSERIAQMAAPTRIEEGPLHVPAQVVAQTDTGPTISAGFAAQVNNQVNQQQASSMQSTTQPAIPVRRKLGISAPTVNEVSHQLPSNVGNEQPTQIAYARPAPSTLQPTPPVGALLQQQQAQQMGGNVLPNQQPVQQMNQPQAMKVPDTARLYNGQLYIPVESTGVSGIPQGAVMIDNKVYVPLASAGAVAPAAGIQGSRFGMQTQQITDPAQIPGLSMEEINYYRNNPVMFQNYLQQMQIGTAQQFAQAAAVRQAQAPRYLQNAVQQAQQQQNANLGFFSNRRIGGY